MVWKATGRPDACDIIHKHVHGARTWKDVAKCELEFQVEKSCTATSKLSQNLRRCQPPGPHTRGELLGLQNCPLLS